MKSQHRRLSSKTHRHLIIMMSIIATFAVQSRLPAAAEAYTQHLAPNEQQECTAPYLFNPSWKSPPPEKKVESSKIDYKKDPLGHDAAKVLEAGQPHAKEDIDERFENDKPLRPILRAFNDGILEEAHNLCLINRQLNGRKLSDPDTTDLKRRKEISENIILVREAFGIDYAQKRFIWEDGDRKESPPRIDTEKILAAEARAGRSANSSGLPGAPVEAPDDTSLAADVANIFFGFCGEVHLLGETNKDTGETELRPEFAACFANIYSFARLLYSLKDVFLPGLIDSERLARVLDQLPQQQAVKAVSNLPAVQALRTASTTRAAEQWGLASWRDAEIVQASRLGRTFSVLDVGAGAVNFAFDLYNATHGDSISWVVVAGDAVSLAAGIMALVAPISLGVTLAVTAFAMATALIVVIYHAIIENIIKPNLKRNSVYTYYGLAQDDVVKVMSQDSFPGNVALTSTAPATIYGLPRANASDSPRKLTGVLPTADSFWATARWYAQSDGHPELAGQTPKALSGYANRAFFVWHLNTVASLCGLGYGTSEGAFAQTPACESVDQDGSLTGAVANKDLCVNGCYLECPPDKVKSPSMEAGCSLEKGFPKLVGVLEATLVCFGLGKDLQYYGKSMSCDSGAYLQCPVDSWKTLYLGPSPRCTLVSGLPVIGDRKVVELYYPGAMGPICASRERCITAP
ncbi:hypothetical protein ACIPJK_38715 [Streptomyces roseus]|uniref:hypothetical protein n=1 Tax=Streptomyces roseus TaxID=66430 RepID=UPI003816684F